MEPKFSLATAIAAAAAAALQPPPTVHLPPGAFVYHGSRDDDQDGIPDATEAALLAKYTPYMRFSIDGSTENYRPADVMSYVKHSELQNDGDEGEGVIVSNKDLSNNPALLLSQNSDVTGCDATQCYHYFRKDRYLNPRSDGPRAGEDWGVVTGSRNVGLYGHVVLFQNAAPQAGPVNCMSNADGQELPGCSLDSKKTYYKIEYWQFFGYSDSMQTFDLGDHEGDWCTVQVFADVGTGKIAEVDHFFHGKKASYRTGLTGPTETVTMLDGGTVEQLTRNLIGDLQFTWNKGPVANTMNQISGVAAENRVLRLYKNPATREYTHPVVYIGHGSHEFWPTEFWTMAQDPKHNGKDVTHSYLAARPPNLGEVEHPLAETDAAAMILRYNGHWGAFNHHNSPPQGPPLHRQWTYPTVNRTFAVVTDGY